MSLTTEIGMDVMLNISNAAQAVNDIEKTIGSGVDKGLTGSLKTQQTKITKSYASALVGALRLSNKEAAANLNREFKQRNDRIQAEARVLRGLERSLDQVQDRNQKKQIRQRIAASKELIQQEQRALQNMADTQIGHQREALKLLDDGLEKTAKNFGEKLEAGVGVFQDLLSSAMGDPSDFIRKLGSEGKDKASGIFATGAQMAAGGGMKAGLGKLIMGLGRALPVLAGAAAAIAGIVAVLTAAYGQTKEWNKALLETGSAFDIAGSAGGDLGAGLETLRTSVSQTSRRFGIATDEVLKYVGAFNEAGITFSEMKGLAGTTDALRAFNQVQTYGIKFTRSLGIEMSDLASLTHRMHEQLGMDLRGIDESLQGIAGNAQAAGMSTRSFFTAISEATSGMALYNFRLEDTSELLLELVKVLGEDLAKSTLQMEGVFRGAGTQDRMKATMTGGGALKSVLAAAGKRQVEGFFSDLSQAGRAVLSKEGFVGRGGEIDYKKLGQLRGPELARVMRELEGAGVSATAFRDVTRSAAGVSGGFGARSDALGALDRMGEMSAKIAQGMGVLNVKDFGSLRAGTADRAAFEELTGIQGEQFDQMAMVFNDLQYTLSQQKGRDVSLQETLTAFAAGEIKSPEAEALAKQLEEQGDPAMSMAAQQLDATRTVGDVLATNIAGLLNWIGGGITQLVDMFINSTIFGGSRDDERREIEARAAVKNQTAVIGDLQADLRKALASKDEGRAKEIEAQIAQAEKVKEAYAVEAETIAGGGDAAEAMKKRLVDIYGEKMIRNVMRKQLGRDERATQALGANSLVEQAIFQNATYGQSIGVLSAIDADKEGLAALESLLSDQKEGEAKQAEAARKEQEKQLAVQKEIDEGIGQVYHAIKESTEENRRLAFAEHLAGTGLDAEAAIGMLRGGQGGTVLGKLRGSDNKISREAAAFLQYYGGAGLVTEGSVRDFIYRGGARGGIITPIDRSDQLLGMKPGGAFDRAGGFGRSVVINHLTINESGNPKKTLQMVKRAIQAARV